MASEIGRVGWLSWAGEELDRHLRSPRVRAQVRRALQRIDPENAERLAQVAVGGDPSFPLQLLHALPRVADALTGLLSELLRLVGRVPVPVLAALLREQANRANLAAQGEAAGRFAVLGLGLAAAPEDWPRLVREFLRGLDRALKPEDLAQAIVQGAAPLEQIAIDARPWIAAVGRGVEQALADHPALVEALRPLVTPFLSRWCAA